MKNNLYSHKDFTNQDLTGHDVNDFNNTDIFGSCFYQQTLSDVFPNGITGVNFINCNLDNVNIPPTNDVTGGSNKKVQIQIDKEDWYLNGGTTPIEPVCKKQFEFFGISTNPLDIVECDESRLFKREIYLNDYDSPFVMFGLELLYDSGTGINVSNGDLRRSKKSVAKQITDTKIRRYYIDSGEWVYTEDTAIDFLNYNTPLGLEVVESLKYYKSTFCVHEDLDYLCWIYPSFGYDNVNDAMNGVESIPNIIKLHKIKSVITRGSESSLPNMQSGRWREGRKLPKDIPEVI